MRKDSNFDLSLTFFSKKVSKETSIVACRLIKIIVYHPMVRSSNFDLSVSLEGVR